MATTKWIYNEGDTDIQEEGTGETVFYVYDIHPEIIKNVVQLWNQDNGSKIRTYLKEEMKDKRLTEDEYDDILDNIEAYEKMEKEQVNSNYIAGTDPIKVKEQPFPYNLDTPPTGNVQIPVSQVVDNMPDKMTTEELTTTIKQMKEMADTVITPAEDKKTRVKKANPISSGSKKKLSPEEYIQSMQEKLNLMKAFSSIQSPDILVDGMSNAGVKLIGQFNREYDALLQKYLELIQEL